MLEKVFSVFTNILFRDTKTIQPVLGRWCISSREYSNRKIDMANIDHCGTCYYVKKNHEKLRLSDDNKAKEETLPK